MLENHWHLASGNKNGGVWRSGLNIKQEYETMATWVDAAVADELMDGEHTVIETDIGPVALFNIEGRYIAIEDRCSHDGGDLACGKVNGDEITCPRHGARFSLSTGEALSPPAYEEIEVFPTRVQNGMLQIDMDG